MKLCHILFLAIIFNIVLFTGCIEDSETEEATPQIVKPIGPINDNQITFNESTVLSVGNTSYKFAKPINFTSVRINDTHLWLNNIAFYVNGTGENNITFHKVNNTNDFNFTFCATENGLYNFTVANHTFYRTYKGENIYISLTPEQKESNKFTELFGDDIFEIYSLLPLMFVMMGIFMVLYLFLGIGRL